MKLFTKSIDKQLFEQYSKGSDLENQKVIAKIFNPYGRGVWYIMNSDPTDPDYLWAIVDLFEPEMGSVSREELETLRVPPFGLGLERDLYFDPKPAKEVWNALMRGERFEKGGSIAMQNKDMLENQTANIMHHAEELHEAVKKTNIEIMPWVLTKLQRATTDLQDITHYLDGEEAKFASGGMTAGRWYKDKSGKEFRYVGESQGKLLFNDGEKIVEKEEDDFEEEKKEKKLFGFFEEGGETSEMKEDFLEDMGELHGAIKEVTLKDGSKISHKELMESHKMEEGGFVEKTDEELKGMNDDELFAYLDAKAAYMKQYSRPLPGTKAKKYAANATAIQFQKEGTSKLEANFPNISKIDEQATKDYQETIAKKLKNKMAKGGESSNQWVIFTRENYLKKPIVIDEFFSTHATAKRKLRNLQAPNVKETYFMTDKATFEEMNEDKMAMGGKVKFTDKVKAIKASLLKRKKVSPKVQKDYGKTYSPKEAEESAKRIVGSMVKKEKMEKGGLVSDKPKFKKLMELEDRARTSLYKTKNFSRWTETTGETFRRRWYKMVEKLRGWEGEFKPIGAKSKPEWVKFVEEKGRGEDYNFADVIA